MFDYAVRKARELAEYYETYALNNHASRKCEKQFLWTCKEFVGKNVNIFYLPNDLPTVAMRGTFIKTEDGYDILLHPAMDPAQERFVLCKELFHVIFDHEMFRNMNVLQHIDKTLFGNFEGGSLPGHVVQEYTTHAAAAEFLFPYNDRKQIIASGRQNESAAVAQQYDIPVPTVDHYLSDRAMEIYAIEE